MLKTVIIGASGYTGAELAKMVVRHPELQLSGLYVSENSLDKNKPLSTLYPELSGLVDMEILPLDNLAQIAQDVDIAFLATAHQVSHDIAPTLLDNNCVVFDLSGAYRVNQANFYTQFYGFEHQYSNWLDKAVYGLAEWNAEEIKQTQLVAVAGCYPTASQLPLKPLIESQLLNLDQWPIINATSGVSGAGRKATLTNSFCQVSLQPYGVFNHRHQPEIAIHLGTDIIFTPHLGNFKRGILATITCKLAENVTDAAIEQAFNDAYADSKVVRLKGQNMPTIQQVQHTPFCDIGWKRQGDHIILVSAIDNLLKGASSQAMQCLNIRFGFDMTASLL